MILRVLLYLMILMSTLRGYSQLYVLSDQRPDSMDDYQQLYDSLPQMCDSFFNELKNEDLSSIKKFVPQIKYLRSTFDTLDIEYNEQKVILRQQLLLRTVQKDYRKIIKNAEKNKLKLKKLVHADREYEYGVDDKGNRYCYVTDICKKKKHTYNLKYVAIMLNGKWFLGERLLLEQID